MKIKLAPILLLIFLCACSNYEEDKAIATAQIKQDASDVQGNITKNVMRVANNVRDGIKRTNNSIRDWWITPLPSTEPQAVANRYCYKVYQDIICYRSQMLGWEDKLVGYQGATAKSPKQPVTVPLDLRSEKDLEDLDKKEIANTKPVFSDFPEYMKEKKKEESGEAVVDKTHESLPESLSVPQL